MISTDGPEALLVLSHQNTHLEEEPMSKRTWGWLDVTANNSFDQYLTSNPRNRVVTSTGVHTCLALPKTTHVHRQCHRVALNSAS